MYNINNLLCYLSFSYFSFNFFNFLTHFELKEYWWNHISCSYIERLFFFQNAVDIDGSQKLLYTCWIKFIYYAHFFKWFPQEMNIFNRSVLLTLIKNFCKQAQSNQWRMIMMELIIWLNNPTSYTKV